MKKETKVENKPEKEQDTKMITQFNIDKSILPRLKRQLPTGAIGVIAQRVGYSVQYVNAFFRGSTTVNNRNIKIARAANQILEEQEREKISLERELTKHLPKRKPSKKKSA